MKIFRDKNREGGGWGAKRRASPFAFVVIPMANVTSQHARNNAEKNVLSVCLLFSIVLEFAVVVLFPSRRFRYLQGRLLIGFSRKFYNSPNVLCVASLLRCLMKY